MVTGTSLSVASLGVAGVVAVSGPSGGLLEIVASSSAAVLPRRRIQHSGHCVERPLEAALSVPFGPRGPRRVGVPFVAAMVLATRPA